jgi:amino acid permease
MSTWIYGLQAGGAAAIMWSWIIGGAGGWALAMSLAELASAYPSAGAMYSVLKFVAPEGQAPLLCWMSGKYWGYSSTTPEPEMIPPSISIQHSLWRQCR